MSRHVQYQSSQLTERTIRLTCSDTSFDQWWRALCTSPVAALRFSERLAATPFSAVNLELPALTTQTTHHPFECVVLNNPTLARVESDSTPFAAPFANTLATAPDANVAAFANLRGDSTLVAPIPVANDDFPHLATFVRTASNARIEALWKRVGMALGQHLDATPVWLSTAGLGVSWLHVRLDPSPKYYRYRPYRDPAYLPLPRG